jgi:hypothetical protein
MLSDTITPSSASFGIDRLEARHVEVLPDVEQHQAPLALVGRDDLDRVAAAELDELRQPAPRAARGHSLLGGVEIDRHHLRAALARGIGEEQRRVAVARPELEDPPGRRRPPARAGSADLGPDRQQELVAPRAERAGGRSRVSSSSALWRASYCANTSATRGSVKNSLMRSTAR